MHRPKPIKGIRRLVKRRPEIAEAVHETTAGGVIWRRNPKTNATELLLIQDAKKRWTIPKGHVEPGEDPKITAEREIREETGLQEMQVITWLGKVHFRYRRNRTLVLMTMHIYLVHGLGDTQNLKGEDWLSGMRWMSANEAIDKIAYEDIGKLILIGLKRVRESKL
ncbi:NUDIX domain-containing protein [Patescibacteria group bacterium]|nr:NUDIX domain-containing protein [Patescibacteria group bacterium]